MTEQSKLEAIQALLNDETKRKSLAPWKAIFENATLTPSNNDPDFQKAVYGLLLAEADAGYRRKENLSAEEKREMGRAAKITHLHMNVTAEIGRYIFAIFKWHTPEIVTAKGIETKGLEDIAEAFNFQIDPAENRLQFQSKEDRGAHFSRKDNEEHNYLVMKLIVGGLVITAVSVIGFLMRKLG